ncbi:carbon-nitrogen hydrolase family protein [Sulfuricurvum sp. IAE1]|uniref:carbon-nitrogen hydrolase family protein n=1 Tax=Sulfuricurvum sp. IAE1 TaxID=2546102 RepID=UPI0014052A89|nr:carbon-nitrogen hydrolase family protein [Sulfuricurvum sp. IAE1]MDD3770275.1 carbon-nitrogen hydrolase family protein [Sulfuricurvum sp.]
MTTSNSRSVVSLCFPTDPDFDANLERLSSLIAQTPQDAIVVAPEVALSGFAYDRFDEAADFTLKALDTLQNSVGERLLIFTAITRTEEGMMNVAYALHAGRIIHTQAKAKLFALGGEEKYFVPGSDRAIVPFEFEGIRIGILICFELRFKTLWQQLEGCDLIAVSAQWGKLRSEHFVTLTNALAVMNQCYVIASDAANEDTSGMGGIITPFGGEIRNSGAQMLTSRYESRTVASMRRYLNVGIA